MTKSNKEAEVLLASKMAHFQSINKRDLEGEVGQLKVEQVVGKSGVIYTIEIEVIWDAKPGGPIRVVGSIDDGGLISSIRPMTRTILVSSEV